jgi:hypothetical protein
MATVHHTPFDEPRFRKAYARAVRASGWDYNIPWRVHQALWCAQVAQGTEGDFVELGTGRGFIMSALLEDGLRRRVHLFDTFSADWMNGHGRSGEPSPYYARSFDEVRENFAEWPNALLHKGDLYERLPQTEIGSVAFLHVDLNNADAEEFGIRYLWPKMPKGAVMLLDDYAHKGFETQYERINLLTSELDFAVLTTPTGQGIVVKR